MKIDDYRIDSDSKVKLERWRPDDADGVERTAAEAAMPGLLARMLDLQERLYAGRERSLLIVLQGRDAAGKDGTIKHVMGGFNPLGTVVHAFKAPNELERGHDFLWRVHHRPQRVEAAHHVLDRAPDRPRGDLQPLALRGHPGADGPRDVHAGADRAPS